MFNYVFCNLFENYLPLHDNSKCSTRNLNAVFFYQNNLLYKYEVKFLRGERATGIEVALLHGTTRKRSKECRCHLHSCDLRQLAIRVGLNKE